ncbi:MAG: SpoIIE family protein phosphatase [Candidatus Gracilibacteria bacterium]|jgi:serine phosphatase RsbU (regulator of sigma subunit)
MGLSLRTKLIIAFTAFVVVLFGLSGVLFIREKEQEMEQSIFANTNSFAEFTAHAIIDNYELNWVNQNVIYFNKAINDFLSNNTDINTIKLVSYQGEILYSYLDEREKPYTGTKRMVGNQAMFPEIQSQRSSIYTSDQRILFIKKLVDGSIVFTDAYDKEIEPLKRGERIAYFVSPVDNKYAVFYELNYSSLDDALNVLKKRILLLGLFGVMLGVIMAYLFAERITKPITKITQGAAILAKGDFNYLVDVRTGDELEILANAFNGMAREIEKSTKAMIYKERVTKELELASRIQKEILPKQIPQTPTLDIAAGLIPAEEIGGDCYDFITMGSRLLMYIGDVTGHGVPSGLVAAVANAVIYSFSDKAAAKEILIETNKVLKAKTMPNMFMTLGMMDYSEETKKITYVNAGHEPLLYYSAKDKKVTSIESKGIALGMFPDISKHLESQEIEMQSGDTILAYSDGIPEAWKNERENYGMSRLKRAFSDYASLSSALAIRNAVLSDVKEYIGGYKQMDDITLIVIKRK